MVDRKVWMSRATRGRQRKTEPAILPHHISRILRTTWSTRRTRVVRRKSKSVPAGEEEKRHPSLDPWDAKAAPRIVHNRSWFRIDRDPTREAKRECEIRVAEKFPSRSSLARGRSLASFFFTPREGGGWRYSSRGRSTNMIRVDESDPVGGKRMRKRDEISIAKKDFEDSVSLDEHTREKRVLFAEKSVRSSYSNRRMARITHSASDNLINIYVRAFRSLITAIDSRVTVYGPLPDPNRYI